MLYLITGANGTGKTLLTLKDVREKSVAESRPVYHNGRFEPVEGGELESWKKIDVKDWQSLPDGAIIVVDECHNDFPVRAGRESPPEYVRMLAEHRRRGFDFYLITQHPMNIDSFVRRLIGSPGWHRHLKRASGAPLVSVLEWASVVDQPQKSGSGESGSVVMRPYPKEVYEWYRSTSLNTAKIKIPFTMKLLIAVLAVFPVVAYYGYKSIKENVVKRPALEALAKPQFAEGESGSQPGSVPSRGPAAAGSPFKLVSFVPSVAEFPESAPAYDPLRVVTTMRRLVAGWCAADVCECRDNQGIVLELPRDTCAEFVKRGRFDPYRVAVSVDDRPLNQSPSTAKQLPL